MFSEEQARVETEREINENSPWAKIIFLYTDLKVKELELTIDYFRMLNKTKSRWENKVEKRVLRRTSQKREQNKSQENQIEI